MPKKTTIGWLGAAMLSGMVGCSPTVTVAPPDKPIVINMNIKIEHDIRVKLDKEVDNLINQNSDLF